MFPGVSALNCVLCSSVLCCSLRHYFKENQLEEKHCFSSFKIKIFLNSRVDIAHLCLYNLSVIHKKKYFDSELELMAYINENWDRLHPGEVSNWTTLWLSSQCDLRIVLFWMYLLLSNNELSFNFLVKIKCFLNGTCLYEL